MMREKLIPKKDKKRLESFLLVFMLVVAGMVVIFPLTAPKAKAVVHLASAGAEDGNPAYDTDGVVNGIVVWSRFDDHIIDNPMGYYIEPGMTLNIPHLNYQTGDPAEFVIEFQGMGSRIDVDGTLTTNPGPPPPAIPEYTAFTGGGAAPWDGIYFHAGSQAVFLSVLIKNSLNGIVMEPGSSLMSPGVEWCAFEDIQGTGMRMDGVTGYTNIGNNTSFYDFTAPVANGIGLDVQNGSLNMSHTYFNSHGPGLSSLHIANADVNANFAYFDGNNQPGYSVFVEGTSNGTVLDNFAFQNGVANNHYIRVDGSSILINNNTFYAKGGTLYVIANDDASAISAHPILRNPNSPATTFDNTTINATGGSSVTLQWFKDVYVEDPDGNFIPNAPVRIKDRLGNPALPSVKITNATGWAGGIIVTELIQYLNTRDIFNPFNISAESALMFGYVDPEETISQSIEFPTPNTVIVPFNPIPNTPPIVSQIDTPLGVQSGLVNITFRLEDINIADDGNLSITVEFWDPISGLGGTATADPSSDTTNLNNNTLYTFVWDSRADFPDRYSTEITINITPHDRAGPGTPSETLTFTVDNAPPYFITTPTVVLSDIIAYITWTVNEPAEASVFYGLDGIFDTEIIGTSGSTDQNVTLTGLRPGRNYTFIRNSTDPQGNKRSSDPDNFTFETEVRIQLRKGWNMVSIPPITPSSGPPTVGSVLAPIAGLYDAVQAYDLSDPSDPWKHYRPGKPYGNDLDMIGPPMGLWIHMRQDALLILDHEVPPLTREDWIFLEQGWNFVGYPSVENRAVDTALLGVPYDMVQTYDAATGQWLSYDPGGYSTDTLTQMEMGRGYWIHCTASIMWQVDYV